MNKPVPALTSTYVYTSTMRSSIKNRFCGKKGEPRFDLLLDKHARNKPTCAMRALFCPGGKSGKREERKRSSNSRRDYVCTVTAKIPRWRRRYDRDFPRVFRPAGKRNEERYHKWTGNAEKGEEIRSANARGRAFVRDDSQMLDRSSRYNPTSGMILNKGSHPVKHDRSSPRYVLLGSVAAALSAFRRLRTAGHEPTFGTDVKVRPNLQCYRASYCVAVTFTNDGTLCRMSKLYSIKPRCPEMIPTKKIFGTLERIRFFMADRKSVV